MLIDSVTIEYDRNCKKLKEYIDGINHRIYKKEEREVSKYTLDTSWIVWKKLQHLCNSVGVLTVPSACLGSDDNFMYTWSNSEHYMECEVFGNGAIEFFYRNDSNGETWGEDVYLDRGFEEILEKISLFCMKNI